MGESRVPLSRLADEVTAQLVRVHHVGSAWLFGSIARGESRYSSDIDLIVGVSEEVFRQFVGLVKESIKGDLYLSREELFSAAGLALELDKAPPIRSDDGSWWLDGKGYLHLLDRKVRVDLLPLPHNWQKRLRPLQLCLPHTDPIFMDRIAGDAVLFDRRSGQFAVSPHPF